MCNPAAFYIVTAISTAVSAAGAYSQQKSANAQAKFQAKVAENNALAAQYEGEYAKEAAAKAAKEQRQKTAQIIGRQRAAMGASGIVADEGTFLDLTLDSATQGKLDELAILHEGDMEAWKAEITAGNYAAQGELYRSSQSSPMMAAAPALLSGVSKGIGYYNAMK